MKSGKQRRKEIKERRLKKAQVLVDVDTTVVTDPLPEGAIEANVELLSENNNSYFLPLFYIDRPFTCRDCGSKEIWTAKQQKWWYEVVLGDINSIAVRCRSCRRKLRAEKEAQKEHMAEMAQRKPHPNTSR
jgi:predicted RNA-binding Zn-ribbon protein involved in translation (DUF1610 family)